MLVAPFVAFALLAAALVAGVAARRRGATTQADRGHLRSGARHFYTRRGFLKLAGATAGASVLVYSGADEAFERWQTSHRNDMTRALSKQGKQGGENEAVGLWLGLSLIDRFLPSTVLSAFGRRCFEASVIGLPVLWTTQRVLGGSRPSDESHGPDFVPFTDENSVSGHTFIGAVPWLVLARQARPRAVKALAGLLSPVTGWTRLHDRKHYLSQVLLGWALAFEATRAVVPEPEDESAPPLRQDSDAPSIT